MEMAFNELSQIKGESERWKKRMRVGGKDEEGIVRCYLHVGEGAGQGAGTRPPLLLQSSAQHLKLPLLLPNRGQQGGRTRTLLHSHAESRAQDRTEQDRVNTREQRRFNQHQDLIKDRHIKAESPKYTDIKSQRPWHHAY